MTTPADKAVTLNDDAILEEMIRQATATAVEPGTVVPGMVVDKGSEDKPPIVVSSVSSAGYVRIWDTRTGEESITNRNMLPTQLRKKRGDGSPVFTLRQPDIKPVRGSMLCPLHENAENRSYFESMGFPLCRKSTLRNAHQVTMHMKRRHPEEYKTIVAEQDKKDKDEERQLRQHLLRTATKSAEQEATPTLQ